MTAAGGGRKEQFCGGGTELKEALLGDAQRRFRRVLKGSVFAEERRSYRSLYRRSDDFDEWANRSDDNLKVTRESRL